MTDPFQTNPSAQSQPGAPQPDQPVGPAVPPAPSFQAPGPSVQATGPSFQAPDASFQAPGPSVTPGPSFQATPTYPPPGYVPPGSVPPGSVPPGSVPPGSVPPSPPPTPAPGAFFNTLAIVSLVSSFFISVVAVVLGHIALVQIKRTGDRGRPAALAGLIIGYAGIAFWSIAIVVLLVAQATGGLSWMRAGTVGPFAGTPHPYSSQPSSGGDGAGSGGIGSSDLTFDAGQNLSRSDSVQISDGMLGDREWASTGPKTDGTWSYASDDGTCTATFHQGDLESTVHQNPADDLTTTDSYLATITGSAQADATENASDDYFYYDQPDDDIRVDARSIGRFDGDGRPHITIARAFAVPGVSVDLDVTCDTKTATTDAYNHVLSVTGIVIAK